MIHIPNNRDQIDEFIWQGREPESVLNPVLVGKVGLLVLCYREGQANWERFRNRSFRVHEAPMTDDQKTILSEDIPTALLAAQTVADAARNNISTLVTCSQGRNRSGLVVALALRELHGWSGSECVAKVRERRAGALFNAGFVRYIEELK
jgi:protein-tyrosine phosphatase